MRHSRFAQSDAGSATDAVSLTIGTGSMAGQHHPAGGRDRVPGRSCRLAPTVSGVTLSPLLLAAACSTICAASACNLMLVRWDAWRSRPNASSGPHPRCAIMTPLACSISGMVSCLAASRAYAESCKTCRRDRPSRIWSRVACARAWPPEPCAPRLPFPAVRGGSARHPGRSYGAGSTIWTQLGTPGVR
jgi:hypothetical protein